MYQQSDSRGLGPMVRSARGLRLSFGNDAL
jgi:hypothetical protein